MSWERAMLLLVGVADGLGIGMKVLSNQEEQSVRERTRRRFSDGTGNSVTNENLAHCARLSRNESWKLIGAFGFSGSVILFTNLRDGRSMFKFSSIRDTVAVLREDPPFDFYLLEQDCTFLFAHDEYDNLF